MAETHGDEPTELFESSEFDPGPPTQAAVFEEPTAPTMATPRAQPRPPGPPAAPSRRPNGWFVAIGLAAIAVVAATVALLIRAGPSASRSPSVAPTTAALSPGSSAVLPAVTPTTAPVLLPSLPASATSSTSLAAGNRDPTPAEKAQVESDDNPGPNATIDTIRIADSDPTWALDHISPVAGHEQDVQPSYHVLRRSGGTWGIVSQGSAQVACDPAVPASVAADFADILGTCPSH